MEYIPFQCCMHIRIHIYNRHTYLQTRHTEWVKEMLNEKKKYLQKEINNLYTQGTFNEFFMTIEVQYTWRQLNQNHQKYKEKCVQSNSDSAFFRLRSIE